MIQVQQIDQYAPALLQKEIRVRQCVAAFLLFAALRIFQLDLADVVKRRLIQRQAFVVFDLQALLVELLMQLAPGLLVQRNGFFVRCCWLSCFSASA